MVVEYPSCTSSSNVLCKHVRATRSYYVDLSFLPEGVLVTGTPTADPEDDDLTVESVEILEEDLDDAGCAGAYLTAGRALLVVVSGGTVSDDETMITVCWEQSDGDEDCRDVRLIVSGRSA